MESVSPAEPKVPLVPELSGSNTELAAAESDGAEGADFGAFLRTTLGKSDQDSVNEEELYSSIMKRLLSEKRPELAEAYDAALAETRPEFTRADGYVYVEKSSLAALQSLVTNGSLTKEEAEEVNGKAFTLAQLDGNKELLFDGRGSDNDPTIAVMNMSEAMFAIEALLQKIDSGELPIEARELVEPQNPSGALTPVTETESEDESEEDDSVESTGADDVDETSGSTSTKSSGEKKGSNDFALAAATDRLSVLLPAVLNGDLSFVELRDKEGNTIEKGKYKGQSKDGNRAEYEFSKPLSEYATELTVAAIRDDNQAIVFNVPSDSNDAGVTDEEKPE